MIRLAVMLGLAAPAGAVDLPALGPEIAPCLQEHVTVAPYVAALAAEGWSPVRPFDRPEAQRNLSHAMLAMLQVTEDHADHGHDAPDGETDEIVGWTERWDHRADTIAWIEDASANRTLYERGDAVLLLMGEQITDPDAGLIHRTTCLFGAPVLEDAERLLADVPVAGDLRSLAVLPGDEAALPYASVVVTRIEPPAEAEAPAYRDALITTRVFAVPGLDPLE